MSSKLRNSVAVPPAFETYRIRRIVPALVVTAILGLVLMPVCSAASDTDVHVIKATSVVIEATRIVITAEATTTITLISGDEPPAAGGFMGRPAARTQVKSDSAVFTLIKPPHKTLEAVWRESQEVAEALQRGEEIGRIAFYRPDVLIKENLVVSITGDAYLIGREK